MSEHSAVHPLASFFGVVLRGRTYLNIVYLWLSFPLGLLYFVALVTLLALGFGLIVVWIGFGILFATLLAAWAAAALERVLAMGLLGAAVPPMHSTPLSAAPAGPAGPGQWLRSVFAGPALWKGLAFLFLKFPLGLAGWIVSVVTLSVSGALTCAPIVYALGGTVDLEIWWTSTWADAWILGAIGALLFLLTLHLHNALAFAWARLAEVMLGGRVEGTTAGPRELQPAAAAG